MHLADGSPVPNADGVPCESVVAIGWLDPQFPFPTGQVTERALDAIGQCCLRPSRKTRGYHTCKFCSDSPLWGIEVCIRGFDIRLGSAEVQVDGRDCIFVAPDLIYHYVREHAYMPPAEFLAACERAVAENSRGG